MWLIDLTWYDNRLGAINALLKCKKHIHCVYFQIIHDSIIIIDNLILMYKARQ